MKPDIENKLRALLSKTEENGCTKAEAAFAAALALARKHDIELAEISLETETAPTIEADEVRFDFQKEGRHSKFIAHIFVKCLGVKALRGYKKMVFHWREIRHRNRPHSPPVA